MDASRLQIPTRKPEARTASSPLQHLLEWWSNGWQYRETNALLQFASSTFAPLLQCLKSAFVSPPRLPVICT